VLTTPLLEGTDGVEKMSKSLGNTIGVTETADVMFAKVMSISDELMWRYYLLLTDPDPAEVAAEREKGEPMASKMKLGRAIVADFHGQPAAESAEGEWRRVHQQGQAPTDLRVVAVAPGTLKPRELLVQAGLATSKSEAERLLRQRAVRRDGTVMESGAELRLHAGEAFVLSVGPARHVRVVAEKGPDLDRAGEGG
jgi:tyrosyl-tRNA synthetase